MPQNAIALNFSATNSRRAGPIKTIPDAAHTLGLADVNRYIQFTNAGAITLTIPTNASVPIPISTTIPFEQTGAGQITVAAAGGVTLNAAGGKVASAAQFSVLQLVKTAANVWTLFGDRA